MDEEAPPIGLSEDEAYKPPLWVRPLIGISVIMLVLSCTTLAWLGSYLVSGDELALKAWEFWGDPNVLGVLLLASFLLMGMGIMLFLRSDDNCYALMLLGVMVLAPTMIWGMLSFEGQGGPTLMLVMLLVPLLAMVGLQSREVRRWWFQGEDPLQ